MRQKFDDRLDGSLVDLRKKIQLEERNCKVRHRDIYVGVATANEGRWIKRRLSEFECFFFLETKRFALRF